MIVQMHIQIESKDWIFNLFRTHIDIPNIKSCISTNVLNESNSNRSIRQAPKEVSCTG